MIKKADVALFFIILIFAFEGKEIEGNGNIYSSNDYVFDAFSAFATVGLSTGVTPFFSVGSKLCLILLMYIGRIGPMSVSLSLFKTKHSNNITWKYVDDSLPIGWGRIFLWQKMQELLVLLDLEDLVIL